MNETCGCCGEAGGAPAASGGPPGLDAIPYRAGTHGSVLAAMIARLSSADHPEARALTTREPDDPSIALLDAWACVADVLTFYQECIANEGYLRTATERRSVLELARLVGYRLRPGVAASTLLAFTVENTVGDTVGVPAGTRAQSMPGPERLQPQPFETSEPIAAAAAWNAMRPSQNRPQLTKDLFNEDSTPVPKASIYVKGLLTDLRPGTPIVVDFGDAQNEPKGKHIYRLKAVAPDPAAQRTRLELALWQEKQESGQQQKVAGGTTQALSSGHLRLQSMNIGRTLLLQRQIFNTRAFSLPPAPPVPALPQDRQPKLYAMRLRAAPFGHNVGKKLVVENPKVTPQDVKAEGQKLEVKVVIETGQITLQEWSLNEGAEGDDQEQNNRLFLDNAYEALAPEQLVAILKPGEQAPTVFPVTKAVVRSRTAYGVTAPTTELTIEGDWWGEAIQANETFFTKLRGTVVYAQSEPLILALAPDETPLTAGDLSIELEIDPGSAAALAASGRRLVVAGERDGPPGSRPVAVSEQVILASSEDVGAYTRMHLQTPLQHSYRRASVTVYGNVAPATHGETRREVLGGGDAGAPLQRFVLRQAPLTYRPAPTAAGAESTLELRVDDVRWHEAPNLAGLAPSEHRYILRTDDEQKTSVVFGSGEHGARPPTGTENISAVYRTGIGAVGNVAPERITLLATRPFGIRAVTNPVAATGGADRESRDQARRNAPLAVMALDRLVSVQDYADFARTFAGIGKAQAALLSDGAQRLVHLTIAGTDAAPVATTSDLYQNLVEALRRQGDPYQPLVVAPYEPVALLVSAGVRIHPDYLWEKVRAQIRARLADRFGFDRRGLAQDVTLGELTAAIQAVAGVTFVDVDLLGGVSQTLVPNLHQLQGYLDNLTKQPRPLPRVPALPARPGPSKSQAEPSLLPAQLVYLLPEEPDLLQLELLP